MKLFNFLFFNQIIKVFIFLLININFVKNAESNENCLGCKVENNKCVLDPGRNAICGYNCRPDLYNGDENCYDCSIAFETSLIYSIENEICKAKYYNNCKKIIIDNNQCVNDCNSMFEFGDYCYSSCNATYNMVTHESLENTCQCNKENSYTLEGTAQEKNYLRCVESCPSGYFDEETKYCVQKCEEKTDKITENNGCTDYCGDDFLFSQIKIINGETVTQKYCVSHCPNSAKFYYDTIIPGREKKCLTECEPGDYYRVITIEGDITKYECLDSCENENKVNITLIDLDANIRQCTDIEYNPINNNGYQCGNTNDVTKDFPYQYKYYCLRHCNDTQKLENKMTYFLNYNDNNGNDNWKKFCSEECKENELLPYFDLSTLSCHSKCSETKNKFHFANECINSCDIKNVPYHLEDTGECVFNCPIGYHLLQKENTCYKKCPVGSEYIDEYNKCNTCNISQGYIYEDDEKILHCQKSCLINIIDIQSNEDSTNIVTNEKYYYHKVDDNKCFKTECNQNNDEYKYSIGITDNFGENNPNIFICYKSCKDIPGDFLYEHNYKCYQQIPSSEGSPKTQFEYYYNENGIYKYFTNKTEAKIECSKKGFYYLNKNEIECIKECDSKDDYRILYTLDGDGNINKFGECRDKCPEVNENDERETEPIYFYSSKERICYEQECPHKTMFKLDNGFPKQELNKENCFHECNSNYPYEGKDGKSCYDSCPKFFVEINGKKICVDNCENYYYFDGEFKCLNNCEKKDDAKNETIFYYYNESNICLKSCNIEGQSLKYAFEAKTSSQPCINECPAPYKYNENDKICKYECGKDEYLESIDSRICVSSCGNGKFIINGNICSDNCTEEEPFYYPEIIKTDTMYKCVSNCKKSEKKNYTVFEKDDNDFYLCLEICSKKVVYEGQCLNNCPEGLYQENYKCGVKCESKKYYEKKEGEFYECKDECKGDNKYITSNNECKNHCPFGENFIGKGNKCKSFCSQEDGEYYKKFEDIQGEFKNYSTYKCVEKCSDLITYTTGQNPDNKIYILDDTKECVSEYPSDKIYYEFEFEENETIYYSLCLKDDRKPFSVSSNLSPSGKNECLESCPSNTTLTTYYGNDKICVEQCSNNYDIINTEDNSCVSKCDLNSNYKYLSNETIKKCLQACPSDKKKYSIYDYICVQYCTEPFNFVINEQICDYSCQKGQFANYNSVTKEYECKDSCNTGLVYYENENICYEDCKTGDYKIEYTDICVKSCDEKSEKYYFYEPKNSSSRFKNNTCVTECPNDKPFKNKTNHCIESCQTNSYKYYISTDNICLDKCPDNYVKNGYECLLKCPYDKFENEARNCVESCRNSTTGYYYFYKSEKKCLKKCNENDFITKDYECVSSCPEKTFIDNKKCVDKCPPEKNYYVGIYLETGQKTVCYTDCPSDYPFFTFDNSSHKCSSSCTTYYISNRDPYINSKECVPNCEGDKKYYIQNSTFRECLELCPNDKRYYISNLESNIKCWEKCPISHPYHKTNSYECVDNCEKKYAAYNVSTNIKECVSSCEMEDFWIKEKLSDGSEITLCVKNCSDIDYARYSTPERECVRSCNSTKNFEVNIREGICQCVDLFYYDDSGIKICLEKDLKCGEKGKASEEYPIQVYNSKQCIKNCYNILNPSEDTCYPEGYNCTGNTQKGFYDGKLKCECKYKYYLDNNNKTICLNESEECPNDYKYLIPDKKECVKKCDESYKYIFDYKCLLKDCPNGMQRDDEKHTCVCSYRWYKEPGKNYECTKSDECPKNYPYYIKNTQECVDKCGLIIDDVLYDIIYNDECLSSCEDNKMRVINDLNNNAKYTCRCKFVWSSDGKCANNSKTTCKEFSDENNDLLYEVDETKQCVNKCPESHNYYFNNKCYSNCTKAGDNIEAKSGTKECECKGYWKINNENLIECVAGCKINEITIKPSNQCVPKSDDTEIFVCPHESPYLYNRECYTNCPEGTSPDDTKGTECKCNNIWFRQDLDMIHCSQNESEKCPVNTHPYFIGETKECVQNLDDCIEQDYNKTFNYICYRECPYLTRPKEGDESECECDNDKLYWYSEQNPDDLREYYTCGSLNCSGERNFIVNGTNECIKRCGDIGLYEFAKKCYEKCPLFTKENEKDYICDLITESDNMTVLVDNIKNRIVDIYPDLPEGGLVINGENTSLQIYGLNKGDLNKTDSLRKTNLAYLDFSACINKIYESNNMDSKEDIVVVKLDLKSRNKKLVINPVEYQFINSKNGKILDASVCEKNEVVISYPITYMLNSQKKRNLQEDENEDENKSEEEKEEELRKKDIVDKFNKGKMLYLKDKTIDTFNFNSSIYVDFCKQVEIDGIDLVLQNRIDYLFPNYSFCESICIYDYTDFEGERIYCNCSIKFSIDIDRPHEIKIYEFNQTEIKNNQKGPTNLPVLKCISKAKIGGNAGFYYCIIFICIEIGLLMIIIFYGISSLVEKIKGKTIKRKEKEKKGIEYNNSENDKIKENKVDKNSKYKTDRNINNSNSKRKMKSKDKKDKKDKKTHNPPKKMVETDEEDEKDKNEVINIENENIKTNKKKDRNIKIKIDEKNNFDIFSEPNNNSNNNSEVDKYLKKNGIETQMGFFYSMKKEKKLLRAKYNESIEKDKFDSIIVVLTSIFDKIYSVRVLLLAGKYENIPLMFSLYLLCHMALLTFLTFFYDIKTIKKMWEKENYPNTNYYLLYGFLSNIIVWIIFKLFCCLLNNEYKIKKINQMNSNNRRKKEEKVEKLIYKIKRNIIIYLVLQFLIILFCSFYLITFCSIYIGTKKNIFQSYGIAIVEIIIIKIIYGFILGVLRKVSLYNEIEPLYAIVTILNKYIS